MRDVVAICMCRDMEVVGDCCYVTSVNVCLNIWPSELCVYVCIQSFFLAQLVHKFHSR